MNRFCLFNLVAMITLLLPAAAEEVRLPGDPPQFFIVTAVDEQGIIIQRRPLSSKAVDVPNIVYKPTFDGLRATDANGKALTVAAVRQRVKRGMVVAVSPDEQPIDSIYLTVVKDDTLILLDIFPHKGATGIRAGD